MGDLNSFLHWHYVDVPDNFELRRNEAVYSSTLNPTYYQGNRNAFIDHPEYVWSVFVNQSNDTFIATSTNVADLGRVLVGASLGSMSITISKTGNSGTYYEVRTNGAATSTVTGHFNAFAMDGPGSKVMTVGLNASTATAGLKSGTVSVHNLDITTQGGAGKGANDPDDLVTVSGVVLDHAVPSFSATGTTRNIGVGLWHRDPKQREARTDLRPVQPRADAGVYCTRESDRDCDVGGHEHILQHRDHIHEPGCRQPTDLLRVLRHGADGDIRWHLLADLLGRESACGTDVRSLDGYRERLGAGGDTALFAAPRNRVLEQPVYRKLAKHRISPANNARPGFAEFVAKNPALVVFDRASEPLHNIWGPAGCFRLPAKACRPQPPLCVPESFISTARAR